MTFRPNLLATTSFDGSLATTFKRTVTDTVCDNTRELACPKTDSLQGQALSLFPRPASAGKGGPRMVHAIADDFAAEVAELCPIECHRPVGTCPPTHRSLVDGCPTGEAARRTGTHHGENKRGVLKRLYADDVRVAPWRGAPTVSSRP